MRRVAPFAPIFPAALKLGALLVVTGASCERVGPEMPDAGVDAGPTLPEDAGPERVPDEEPPVVSFVAPEEDCLEGEVTFRFEVKDADSGVGFVSATFGARALPLVDDGQGRYEASFDVSAVHTGRHTLRVSAIDRENNLTEVERVYGTTRDDEYFEDDELACGDPPPPVVDEEPPVVELLSPPPANVAFAASTLYVSARVTDDLGPVTAEASIGDVRVPLTGVTTTLSATLDVSQVAEGPQDLTITATDGAARTTSVTREVILDRTPPSVAIIEPLANEERVAFTDVVCEASDDNGIALVSLYEVGNEVPLETTTSPSEEGRYGVIYRLPCENLPRETTFEMRVTDRAGNAGSAFVDVTVNEIGCGIEP